MVTNTGDFRRYSYSTDTAYALKAFEASRSSAAPSYTPSEKNFKVRENLKNKSMAQLRAEQSAGFSATVKILLVSVLSIAMLFGVVYTCVQKNELTHEIAGLEAQLSAAESENTRLNSELNSLVSMSMIDKYAVEKLGMTKVQSNQIQYIDVSQYKEKHFAAAQLIEQSRRNSDNTSKTEDK